MDVFQQNWTQRMHKEPFTNYILNSKGQKDNKIKMQYIQFVRRGARSVPEYDTQIVDWNERAEQDAKEIVKRDEIRIKRGLTDAPDQRNQYYGYKYEVLKGGKLYDNSRPISLYNLNYASLR